MVNLTSLKEYFSILLNADNAISSEHPFAEDERRFFLFNRIRGDFHEMHIQMDALSGFLPSTYPDYVHMVTTLRDHFDVLSRISNEDFDYYLRTLAVEKLLFTQEKAGAAVPEMLEHLLQGVMQLFIGDGDDMKVLVCEALKNLREKQKKKSLFESKNSKCLRDTIEKAFSVYEQIEHDLCLAKEGIVAKDKRMLELLQKLRIGLGDALVKAAVEQAPMRMPSKNVVSFTEAVKRAALGKHTKAGRGLKGGDPKGKAI